MPKAARESRRAEKLRRKEASARASAPARGELLRTWGWIGLLLAAGLLVFANSWQGSFIYDDQVTIVRNPTIRSLWPPAGILRGLVNTPTAGRPLVGLSFALNYAAGGLNVAGYHAVNIGLHLLAALILFGVVRRTLNTERLRTRFAPVSAGLAAACALIWMVHPLQTEAVNYVSQRTELMMGVFFLLTLYAAIRAGEEGAPPVWAGVSVAACAAGMASKETMVVAPVAVALYDWCYRPGPFGQVVRKRWRLYAGLAAGWIVLAALMWSGPRAGSVGFSTAVSPLTYAMNQCRMVVHYLRLAIWPHPLIVDYGPTQPIPVLQVVPGAALVGVLGAAALAALWRRLPVGFPAAWVFLVLAPTSSIVPIATEVGAERRMYLPLAGIAALAVVAGFLWLERMARGRRAAAAAARPSPRFAPAVVAGLALVLGLASASRNLEFRDPIRIWTSVVAARPSWRAHNNLATELSAHHRYAESIEHYRLALQDQPESVEIRYNLAHDLEAQGQIEEALVQYREFLKRRPDPLVHNIVGLLLAGRGKPAEAMAEYREALRLDPSYPDPHGNLGNILLAEQRYQEAADEYALLLERLPEEVGVHNNLGLALAQLERPDEAIAHYRRAVALRPDFAEAHFNLGIALSATGKPEEGRRQLREAARLDPKMSATAERAIRELSGVDGGNPGQPVDGSTGHVRPRQR